MSHPSESARILIVEDEGIIALRMQEVVEQLGHTVIGVAASLEEALALGGEQRPDLALLDVTIHGDKDGISVAQMMRALWSVPVIFVTAHADASTLERITDTDPFGYVMKPFSSADIRAALDGALNRMAAEQVVGYRGVVPVLQ